MPPAHSPAHTISSAPAAATAPSQEKPALPKYGFVAMLQEVFGVSDLLENNRFLNKVITALYYDYNYNYDYNLEMIISI